MTSLPYTIMEMRKHFCNYTNQGNKKPAYKSNQIDVTSFNYGKNKDFLQAMRNKIPIFNKFL